MRLIDLTDKDREFRENLVKGLRLLLQGIPSGSTWLREQHPNLADDDIKILVRWINALESFTPSRDQNQLDLKFIMSNANQYFKVLKARTK